MKSDRVRRKQNNSEQVVGDPQKSLRTSSTISRWPLIPNDTYSPALKLGPRVEPSRTFLPHSLQAKLRINEPGDQYEHEADRVAEQVMRMPEPAIRLQRKCCCGGSCASCADEPLRLQRHSAGPSLPVGTTAPATVHDVLRSPGHAFDENTRSFFEGRFRQDFGDVRIHTHEKAAASAREINAQAYTVGQHIVFASGQYAPGTAAGARLLAHELTHVIQQSPGVHRQAETIPAISQVSEPRVSRFSDTGHHVIEEAALAGAGFSAREIEAIERGNIQRDYSQIGRVGNALLLCRPQRFGGYEPEEHFDNFIFDAVTNRWRTRGVGRQFRHADPNTPDPTPIDYIESQLMNLARAGMTEGSLIHLGNALHTVEDFFAHSNFVELINRELQGAQTLLTGSVPGTQAASVAHVLSDISGPPMREYYRQQGEAATAGTEPDSHARMAHDTPDSHNYAQARRLAALVVQNLGVDVRAALQQPQAAQRTQLMTDIVMVKIRRFLRPPSQNDRWWEQLVEQDTGVMDRRLEEVARRTPVTVNQCVFSPLRNIEASSSSSWRMPIGVALPVQVGSTQIWLQIGGGVSTPFPLDRSVRETPTRGDEPGGLIVGGQITGRF